MNMTAMETRPIGRSGIRASAIGLGTWAIGGWMWGGTDEAASIAAIRAALDAGVSLVDTAPAYGMGRSEEIVGKAIAGRRDEVVLATKCGLVWHTDKGRHFFDQDGRPVHRYLGAESVVFELEQSLRRLGTDRVEAYYLHWPNHDIPIAESLEGLVKLKAAGKIRSAGVCNFGPVDLADLRAAKDAGVVVLHQLPYSLFWRAIEYDILPATSAMGLDVVAYSVLAQGLLTGRYGSSSEVPRSLHATRFYGDGPHGDTGAEAEIFAALPGLRALAAEAGVSLPDLAIRWALAQPGVSVVLTGARTVAEIEANARALEVKVDPAVLAAATALSEPVKARLGSNPDMWMAGEKSRFR